VTAIVLASASAARLAVLRGAGLEPKAITATCSAFRCRCCDGCWPIWGSAWPSCGP